MSEPLSFEQAVQTLAGEPEPVVEAEKPGLNEAIEAVDAQIAAAVEPTEDTEAATTAEDAPSEADEPGDEGTEGEEEAEPVAAMDPPAWWKAEAKAKFAELPPELQAVVHEQETVRERVVSEAKAQAAETVRAAQKEMEGVQTLAQQLNDFLPQALETFKSRWGEAPDWAAVAREQGAEEAFILKSEWEAQRLQLEQVKAAAVQAETQAFQAFVQSEFTKLAEIAPELADPVKGPQARETVTKFLINEGIAPENIRNITAAEMRIANEARLYRELMAKSKTLATTAKPIAAPAKSALKPAAAQASATPQRLAQQAQNRFAQTRTVEDAIALLASRG